MSESDAVNAVVDKTEYGLSAFVQLKRLLGLLFFFGCVE